MQTFKFVVGASLLLGQTVANLAAKQHTLTQSFTNPMLPGWHSDPSCIFVPEENNTFFCTTSSFLVTPGLSIHASKDLRNWKIVSHVISRRSQWDGYRSTSAQNGGIYAPTLRYYNGTYYLITAYFADTGINTMIFSTGDIFDSATWNGPMNITTIGYDPDLFWDDDGQSYLTTTPVNIAPIDLSTGDVGTVTNVWNGTGGVYPEGPHIYKKDGYYYLQISEGGTELGHSVTIARSQDILGPYESFSGNPILTNRNTSNYFQTVGHTDIFQDSAGNYWACALSTRSGPEWTTYPMGRETVLTAVTWEKDQWPVYEQVQGQEIGWTFPPTSRNLAGIGPFITDPDVVDFAPGSAIPGNFMYWRWPLAESFTISPPGHANSLEMKPTGQITTQDGTLVGADGITFIGRLQTDTRFVFSANIDFEPQYVGEEAGLTVFLTQEQHLDIGIVRLASSNSSATAWKTQDTSIRFRTYGLGKYNGSLPIEAIMKIPSAWKGQPISFQIEAVNETTYAFSAAPNAYPDRREVLGYAPSTIVSGGSGRFTGSLVGAYATTNNGTGDTPSYLSKWRYTGKGQNISN